MTARRVNIIQHHSLAMMMPARFLAEIQQEQHIGERSNA
jgi:hypothetical protein